MQVWKNLLRIIFMLSTIVAVTDCCSSRVLFLKERTINIIQERKQQYEQYIGHEMANTNLVERLRGISMFLEGSNKTDHHNPNQTDEVYGSDRPPPREEYESVVGSGSASGGGSNILDFSKQLNELFFKDAITQSRKHKNHETPGYQLIDIYESIMNNVLSFACTGQFLTDFCLNGGRCFSVPVGNQSLFSCECADGYVGERCESKSVNGVYMPPSALDNRRRKILTARIVFSFPMLIFLTVVYLFFGMVIVFKWQPPFLTKYKSQNSRAAGLLLT